MGFFEFAAGLGSGVVSFLGGGLFRMVWGEVSSYLNKRQDHKYELERMELQGTLDGRAHERLMTSMRFQAEQQVKVIEVAARGEVDKIEAGAWASAVHGTTVITGIWFVDMANAIIRPGGAVWALYMLTANEYGWLPTALSDTTANVCFAFIGLFVADRTLGKRGK